MKLLFDQNLSLWLCTILADCFPGAIHVREVGMIEADDATIWQYAAHHGLAIVTKDRQRSFLQGHPPKIVWVRLGNCSTNAVAALLRTRSRQIEEFFGDDQQSFLALS